MATATLALAGHTYVSPKAQSADNTGVTNPRTSRAFYLATKDNYANWNSAASSAVYSDGALLRFTRTSTLKYSKITSATLHLVLDGTISGASQIYNRWYIAKYETEAALSAISWSSFRTAGILGEWTTGGNNAVVSSPYSYDINVTSLFNGDLSATDFTLCVAAGDIITNPTNLETHIVSASTYLSVTYETPSQPAPTPLFPKDQTIIEADSTMFSWQFNSETSATQSAIVLEYKEANDADYTVISSTQTALSYTLNTRLPAGSYQWRMKATNDAGTQSGYSDIAYFNIVGRPAVPIINTPANKALTEITWNTSGQQSFEIILADQTGRELVHETLATAEAVYKPNTFLKGQYLVSVRVMNDSMMWSDWAEKGFTISAAGPAAATIKITSEAGIPAVRIGYTLPADVNAVLMRQQAGEAKILAVLDASLTEYIDDTVSAETVYTYFIRTYVNGYTDSTKLEAFAKFDGAIFQTEKEFLNLKVSDEQYLPHSEEISAPYALNEFSGRSYYVMERGETINLTIARRFYVAPEQKKLLDRMSLAECIYYRDNKGNAFRAAILRSSYDAHMGDGYLATINIVRLNEEEVEVNV